jgi:hypothetical protein
MKTRSDLFDCGKRTAVKFTVLSSPKMFPSHKMSFHSQVSDLVKLIC